MLYQFIQGRLRHLHGRRHDVHDPRDKKMGMHWPFSAPLAPLPDHVDLSATCSRIEDQQSCGSCVANAITSCEEFVGRKLGNDQGELSRLFAYYAARVWVEGSPPSVDSGCMVRDGMKALATYGVPLEATWPYDLAQLSVEPSGAAVAEARQREITTYLRCSSVEDIQRSLAEGWPVAFGFEVPASFEHLDATNYVLQPPVRGEQTIGGHCIYASGYDGPAKLFWCRNSWGESFGNGGVFGMPFARVNAGVDAWTIRH